VCLSCRWVGLVLYQVGGSCRCWGTGVPQGVYVCAAPPMWRSLYHVSLFCITPSCLFMLPFVVYSPVNVWFCWNFKCRFLILVWGCVIFVVACWPLYLSIQKWIDYLLATLSSFVVLVYFYLVSTAYVVQRCVWTWLYFSLNLSTPVVCALCHKFLFVILFLKCLMRQLWCLPNDHFWNVDCRWFPLLSEYSGQTGLKLVYSTIIWHFILSHLYVTLPSCRLLYSNNLPLVSLQAHWMQSDVIFCVYIYRPLYYELVC